MLGTSKSELDRWGALKMQSELDLWAHCKCNLNLTDGPMANAIWIWQMGALQSKFDRWAHSNLNLQMCPLQMQSEFDKWAHCNLDSTDGRIAIWIYKCAYYKCNLNLQMGQLQIQYEFIDGSIAIWILQMGPWSGKFQQKSIFYFTEW